MTRGQTDRDIFLAEVRELVDEFGARLCSLVERQADAVRSQALGKLRELVDGISDDASAPANTPVTRLARKQQRCSKCQSTAHNARRCDASPDSPEVLEVDAEPEPDPPLASPPPTRAGRVDRFAAIEAAAARRTAERVDD